MKFVVGLQRQLGLHGNNAARIASIAATLPLPLPQITAQVAKEYDAALVESRELPRKPQPPAEGEEAAEE